MRYIHKYPLTRTRSEIDMPEGSQILCVKGQRDRPCIWATVDPRKPNVTRLFYTFKTGQACDADLEGYIGTYQNPENGVVRHVFEVLA